MKDVRKACLAEMTGTAALLFCITTASTAANRIASGNDAFALLVISGTTSLTMFFLLRLVRPISGGYLNPLAAGVLALKGEMSPHDRVPYTALLLLAQVIGALGGAWLASIFVGTSGGELSVNVRSGEPELIGEAVGGFGLALVLSLATSSNRILLVSIYSGILYWITPTISFANPVAALARVFSEGPMGLAPGSAIAVIGAQLVGGIVGAAASIWLLSGKARR